MKLILCYFFPFLFAVTTATPDVYENITAALLESQGDMRYAHSFYQMTTSVVAQEFDEAMHLLERASVPQLAITAETFNAIYASTIESLTEIKAHDSCFEDWREAHERVGEDLSRCTDQQLEETLLIYEMFHFMAFIGEFLTNEVTLRGMEAFRTWQPLTNPTENHPVQFVESALEWDRLIYDSLVLEFLVRVKLDVLSAVTAFEDLTRTCTSAVVTRLTGAAEMTVKLASRNQCSGQSN